MTTATQTSNQQYYNLTTTATGYFNRLRVVQGKGKTPTRLALDFNALNGGPGYENAEQKRFSLIATSAQAKELIKSLIDNTSDNDTLFGKVEISDFAPGVYFPTSGKNAGKPVLYMSGRLIKVHFVTKNGTRIFDLTKTDLPSPSEESEEPVDSEEEIDESLANMYEEAHA